jgi:hypothetical protein
MPSACRIRCSGSYRLGLSPDRTLRHGLSLYDGKGYGSSQLLNDHHQYGFDPTLEYVDVYIPQVAQGMNVRSGTLHLRAGDRGATGAEQLHLQPLAAVCDRSVYRYGADRDGEAERPVAGATRDYRRPRCCPDVDAGCEALGNGLPELYDHVGERQFYLCANGINNGKYAYNNLQQYDATWYHKFSKTVHMATETWYMYERDVPALGGAIQPETGRERRVLPAGEQRCTAPEYAVVNFLQKELSAHDFLSFRSDFLNDKKGQRTGYATRYSENTIMWCHWIGSNVQIRPEVRFERAWDMKAYDNGRRQNQLTVASDLIFHF